MTNVPTRWILTGGSGFLASNLIRLLRPDDGEIVAIDRDTPQWPVQSLPVRYVEQDFREVESYRNLIIPGSVVVHMASSSYPGKAEKNVEADIQDNILGTIRLANACADANVAAFIYFSSGGAIYGDQERMPIKEDMDLRPVSAYGVMKLATEHYLRIIHQLRGLPVVLVRISNPFGRWHRGRGQGVINVIFEQMRRGETIEIWGDGTHVRDFIFAEDASKAVRMIGLAFRDGCEAFNIGTGVGRSLNDILALAHEITGIEPVVRRLPARSVDVQRNVLDCGKIHRMCGWLSESDIERAMRNTWEWMNEDSAHDASAG